MYIIRNGKIITEHDILEGYDLVIQGDRIVQIVPSGQFDDTNSNPPLEIINANGAYVTPGFIDLHSDYIEFIAAPRPTSMMDFYLSLREAEKELITHGITTMYHSLSLWENSEFDHKPIREPKNVQKLIDLIDESHTSKHLVRHRFHARFEIDYTEGIEQLKSYIAAKKVHLLSFMDHSPGQGQYRNLEMYRHTLKGYKNLTDNEIDKIVHKHDQKRKVSFDELKEIADLAIKNQIALASHDDDTFEKLAFVKLLGTTISEFPITMEIAKKAKELNLYTIAGAPNVLLGGSHSGNLSAAEAIKQGYIDILCSDYYPAGVLHAIFNLHEKHGCDLVEMFKLVTIHPARAVKIDDTLGSIEVGKKADILLIDKIENNFPVISAVWVDGHLVQRTHYRI